MTLSSLPLFPLGTVLFPGGVLSLKVFEVRYLDMIGKCHKTGAPFGVVALTQGSEVRKPGASEQFADVGTIALLEALERPQSGLIHIRCKGAQRFQIDARRQLPYGLWVADVSRLPDDAAASVPSDLQRAADALGKLIASLQQRGLSHAQMPPVWALPPRRLRLAGQPLVRAATPASRAAPTPNGAGQSAGAARADCGHFGAQRRVASGFLMKMKAIKIIALYAYFMSLSGIFPSENQA